MSVDNTARGYYYHLLYSYIHHTLITIIIVCVSIYLFIVRGRTRRETATREIVKNVDLPRFGAKETGTAAPSIGRLRTARPQSSAGGGRYNVTQ